MPVLQLSPGVEMFYRDDDFTDPWRSAEVVLMLHGGVESGLVWNGWMPHLGRTFRVVRPDMRGFGLSTPMPVDFPWSIDRIAEDYLALVDSLDIERFHVIAAKTGGPVGLRLAARNPGRVRTLTLVGCPDYGKAAVANATETYAEFERDGIEPWARRTMKRRLGSECAPEMVEGWIKVVSSCALSTVLGYLAPCDQVDIRPDLPHIVCPTLVVTTEGSALGSVAVTRAWQEQISRSELVVLPGDSFHAAVTHPDLCARAALEFIDRASLSNDRMERLV